MRYFTFLHSPRHHFFLGQWVLGNSLTLSFGFIVATWLSIYSGSRLQDMGGPFCFLCEEFPISPFLIFLPGYLWTKTQTIVLKPMLAHFHPWWWIVVGQIGLFSLGGLVWITMLVGVALMINLPTLQVVPQFLSIFTGLLPGVILGALMGVSQLRLASLRREWILWSIFSWFSAIICGWKASVHTLDLLRHFQVESEVTVSLIRIGVLGSVLGLVYGLVSGVGILRCRHPRNT
jgi:hypothetical protein